VSDAFTDIADAVLRLRHALEKHHLNAPAAIDLYAPEDGQRLIAALRSTDLHLQYGQMHPETGLAVNQAEIAGVIFRWPATKRARHGGGFDWV
jgi:hypothetical protein